MLSRARARFLLAGAARLNAVHTELCIRGTGIFAVINATLQQLAATAGSGGSVAGAGAGLAETAAAALASPSQLAALLQLFFAPRNPTIFSRFAQDMLSEPIPPGQLHLLQPLSPH